MYLQYSSFYPKYDRYLVLNTNLFKQHFKIQNMTDIWYKIPTCLNSTFQNRTLLKTLVIKK